MWWLVAGAALAQTSDLAEESDLLFRRGVEAYRAGDYAGALERLLASERLVPNRNVAFNVARCYEQLGELDHAWRYYASYAADEPDATARREAEDALARLAPKVAQVRITSDPPGATVYVDREDLGARGVTPLVLALPPGEHAVLVRSGDLTSTSRPSLVVGHTADVNVRLPRPAPPSPAPGSWTGTRVRTGATVLATVGPHACALLPDLLQGAGASREGPSPAWAPGAVLAAGDPPGLAVDTTLDERTVEARLARTGRRAVALADASPLHATLFARCTPTNPGGLAAALGSLPSPARLDAVAVFAEWAAWNGAPASAAADACVAGDCAALVAAVVGRP